MSSTWLTVEKIVHDLHSHITDSFARTEALFDYAQNQHRNPLTTQDRGQALTLIYAAAVVRLTSILKPRWSFLSLGHQNLPLHFPIWAWLGFRTIVGKSESFFPNRTLAELQLTVHLTVRNIMPPEKKEAPKMEWYLPSVKEGHSGRYDLPESRPERRGSAPSRAHQQWIY